jgi:exonuclease SbcC
MRLHRLSLTAFGPFAGRVDVDLDTVADGGIFLIRGATGAGKTSLLDAICYALYADVPGARSKKGLHSDHAAPGTVPSVSLELTAAGRRLRLERSPEFRRPKARGTGEVTVPAKAQLEELRDGAWQVLSTRHDEIAEAVDDVLGMGLPQFSKVVVLPQGEFATFLRATPEERRSLLERLFDVDGYVGIEDWLADQRRQAAASREESRRELAALGALASEHVAALGDLGWEAPAWDELPVAQWAATFDELEGRLEAAASRALAELDAARQASAAATAAELAARELAGVQARGRAASAALAQLAEGAQDHAESVATLDRARRAAAVSGDLKALDRAVATLSSAREAARSSGVGVARLGLADQPPDRLEAALDGLRSAGARLADARRACDALVELDVDRARQERRLAADADTLAAAEAALATHVEQRAQLATELEAASAAQAAVATAEHAVEVLRRHLRLRREQDADLAELAQRQADRSARVERSQQLRQAYLDLREARLDGMAGELARVLEDGAPCPVCGAAEHPSPATATRVVAVEEVDAAEDAWRRAEEAVSESSAVVAGLEAAIAQRSAALDGDERATAELAEALELREAALAALRERAAGVAALTTQRDAAEAEVERTSARIAKLRESLAVATAAVAELDTRRDVLRAELVEAMTDHTELCGCAGSEPIDEAELVAEVRRCLAEHDAAVAAVEAHLAATRRLATCTTEQAEVLEAVRAATLEHGFDTIDAARDAVLQPAVREELEAAVSRYDMAKAVAEATLAEPAVQEALAQPEPDLSVVEARCAEAAERLSAATSADTLTRAALAAVRKAGTAVRELCARLAEQEARHELLRSLADTVAGLGPQNELRMRLSAFVLAARLEKVADLANERLSAMGDGRYRLRHTDGLAARGARSGLGLEVLDLWTGQTRETSSLSGGESFMASLALALGLADAVREESGGFDLQTLFIDEGFGTLDDESLEQVLDVLDGLREGGRAVGVVSHVAELRTRIPHQVVVAKDEHGSTVHVRTAAASTAA